MTHWEFVDLIRHLIPSLMNQPMDLILALQMTREEDSRLTTLEDLHIIPYDAPSSPQLMPSSTNHSTTTVLEVLPSIFTSIENRNIEEYGDSIQSN